MLHPRNNPPPPAPPMPEMPPENPRGNVLLLPDELLEHIGLFLDRFSLAAYALSYHRLRRAAEYRGVPLLGLAGVEPGFNHMQPVGSYAISMNLSHLYEVSPTLERTILECRNLTKLNVINANLTIFQLLNVLDHLERLETLSFSLPYVLTDFLGVHKVLKAQRSLRKLFIDCAPAGELFLFLARFLYRCTAIEEVHLNFVGPLRSLKLHTRNSLPARCPHWLTLQTFSGSFQLTNKATYKETVKAFLEFTGYEDNRLSCYIKQNTEFVPFSWLHVAGYNANEVIVTRDFNAVEAEHVIVPKGVFDPALAVNFKLESEIVELDLTVWPHDFNERSWQRLASISTSLRSLACHICALPKGRNFENRRFKKKPADSYALRYLEKLTLTRLHLLFDKECKRCEDVQKCYLLGDLARLEHLEDFTLVGAVPSPNLWDCIANPNLKVIKLCLRKSPKIGGLRQILEFCKNLRYFKLEAPDLPLHTRKLWFALQGANSLQELCLASNAFGKSDLDAVRACLPILMQSMNVLHFHADKLQEIHRVIYEYVMAVNARAPFRNIQMTPFGIVSLSKLTEAENPIWTMPGRNLCCVSPFVNKWNLEGWNDV